MKKTFNLFLSIFFLCWSASLAAIQLSLNQERFLPGETLVLNLESIGVFQFFGTIRNHTQSLFFIKREEISDAKFNKHDSSQIRIKLINTFCNKSANFKFNLICRSVTMQRSPIAYYDWSSCSSECF